MTSAGGQIPGLGRMLQSLWLWDFRSLVSTAGAGVYGGVFGGDSNPRAENVSKSLPGQELFLQTVTIL